MLRSIDQFRAAHHIVSSLVEQMQVGTARAPGRQLGQRGQFGSFVPRWSDTVVADVRNI